MVLLDSFLFRYALCPFAELLQAGHADVAGVAEKLQSRTQQDCTADILRIGKLFH
jgi:hypothetical protein